MALSLQAFQGPGLTCSNLLENMLVEQKKNESRSRRLTIALETLLQKNNAHITTKLHLLLPET